MTDSQPAAAPAPAPVPASLDLRDCPWRPDEVVRRRDLSLALANDAAFRLATVAPAVAWHQVPASSLPGDEATIARLCGWGSDLRGFRRARQAGGLAGWTLAADGRLYHPELARDAIEAFKQRSSAKHKREADAERLRQLRANAGASGDNAATDAATVAGLSQRHRDDVGRLQNKTGQDSTGDRDSTPPVPPGVSPRADARPSGGSGGATSRIRGLDLAAVAQAVVAGDAIGIVRACGGILSDPRRGDQRADWIRDAEGLAVIALAALLIHQREWGKACRWPSGLRAARAEFRAWTDQERRDLLTTTRGRLGLADQE